MRKIIPLAVVAAFGLAGLAGCEQRTPAEQVGEAVDDAGDGISDAVNPPNTPGEKVGEAVDDAADAVDDAVHGDGK